MTAETPDLPPGETPSPSSDSGGTDAVFAGIDELCEQAARGASTDGAALAVVTRHTHTRELVYATDSNAVRLDELQFTLGEGPCLDAYLNDEPQFHPNLDSASGTSRWPTFAAEATALGVHSLFAFPVPGARGSAGPSGVLEFYRRTVGNLTDEQHAAAHAAATAIGHRITTNWHDHLERFGSTTDAIDAAASAAQNRTDPFTRTQVHVAAGILAVQLDTHPEEALDRLRAQSFATGRRISSVAADIIAHRLTFHDEPDPPHH
jgi:GAF domain-containing protein/ANTAR domain-containing protein